MSGTKPLKPFIQEHPDFVPGWRLHVNGEEMPPDTDWKVTSPHGAVVPVVVEGKKPFDRPAYYEAPFAQAVVWGRDRENVVRIAMIDQRRPHADAPDAHGLPNPPQLFRHVPMGFAQKLVQGFETNEEAAKREAGEEVGAMLVLNVISAPFGHNPSPSFTPTWGGVSFIEVDLGRILPADHDSNEEIEGRYWMTVGELLGAIKAGQSADTKAYLGVSTSLSALMLFFAHFPEFFAK